MESGHKIVDSTKDLLTSLSGSGSTSESQLSTASQEPQQSSTTSSHGPPAPGSDDLLGVTSSLELPATGSTVSSGENTTGGEEVSYSATGRDATGTFDGGANEEIPNLGAGELPGKQ